MINWGFVYTARDTALDLHEHNTPCYNNLVQLCSTLAGAVKSDPLQSILDCFTCKHRNPVRNALNVAWITG